MSKIEDEVCEEIKKRAERGLNKYGTTMERSDLTRANWLQHALEEALDLAVYLKRLQHENEMLNKNVERLEALLESYAKIIAEISGPGETIIDLATGEPVSHVQDD